MLHKKPTTGDGTTLLWAIIDSMNFAIYVYDCKAFFNHTQLYNKLARKSFMVISRA